MVIMSSCCVYCGSSATYCRRSPPSTVETSPNGRWLLLCVLLSGGRCVLHDSGATLSATIGMASATKLRRNTVVAAVSTGKLDREETGSSVEIRSSDSMTIETLTSPLSSNKENNNNKSLSTKTSDSPRNHQLKKFSQSTPALPQLHYDLQNLGRSKSRQKKFLRHFPYVPREERVLNRKCLV